MKKLDDPLAEQAKRKPDSKKMPAFPLAVDDSTDFHYSGMTLRDFFAGCALIGQLASDTDSEYDEEQISKWSFNHADAMIAERDANQ